MMKRIHLIVLVLIAIVAVALGSGMFVDDHANFDLLTDKIKTGAMDYLLGAHND